jgi:hypothetical protein
MDDSAHRDPVAPMETTPRSLACAHYNCSCSVASIHYKHVYDVASILGSMVSTITIDGKLWDLGAPPLSIGMRHRSSQGTTYVDYLDTTWQNAGEFWSSGVIVVGTQFYFLGPAQEDETLFMFNETMFEEATIQGNGRCIAEDLYSWGFSSLLLLTFCCYTIAFALALIILETDVYWNSRHDRVHQSHSIYTDVLYLAEELKNTFGQNIEDHMKSPKAFDKKVGNWKQGLRLDVRELPLSRWQDCKKSTAAECAGREAEASCAKSYTEAFTLELRNLTTRDCRLSAACDIAYDGLIEGYGAESSFRAISRSDRGSTSGELVPSLAGTETSTDGSVRDDTVLEDAVAETSLLGGAVSDGAGPARWDS